MKPIVDPGCKKCCEDGTRVNEIRECEWAKSGKPGPYCARLGFECQGALGHLPQTFMGRFWESWLELRHLAYLYHVIWVSTIIIVQMRKLRHQGSYREMGLLGTAITFVHDGDQRFWPLVPALTVDCWIAWNWRSFVWLMLGGWCSLGLLPHKCVLASGCRGRWQWLVHSGYLKRNWLALKNLLLFSMCNVTSLCI
jgi:hypothetical protein